MTLKNSSGEQPKDAGSSKQGQQKQPQQPAQQQPQPARQQPPRRKSRDEVLIIDDIEVLDDPYRGDSVADHVRQHISTADIAEHATNLGEEVAGRDDKVAARIHQKFEPFSRSLEP